MPVNVNVVILKFLFSKFLHINVKDDTTALFLRIESALCNQTTRLSPGSFRRAISYAPEKILTRTEMTHCFMLVYDCRHLKKYRRTQILLPWHYCACQCNDTPLNLQTADRPSFIIAIIQLKAGLTGYNLRNAIRSQKLHRHIYTNIEENDQIKPTNIRGLPLCAHIY